MTKLFFVLSSEKRDAEANRSAIGKHSEAKLRSLLLEKPNAAVICVL